MKNYYIMIARDTFGGCYRNVAEAKKFTFSAICQAVYGAYSSVIDCKGHLYMNDREYARAVAIIIIVFTMIALSTIVGVFTILR